MGYENLLKTDVQTTLFTPEERASATEKFIKNLDQAGPEEINTLLAQAPKLYVLLLQDGDEENAAIINDRTSRWASNSDLSALSPQQAPTSKTNTSDNQAGSNIQSEDAIEEFILLAGHTDPISRIENLIKDGQLLKAVQWIETLSDKASLSPEEQAEFSEMLEAIIGLANKSGDMMAMTSAGHLLLEWHADFEATEEIIAPQNLSRQEYDRSEQRRISASTHSGASYDNEPKQRNVLAAPAPV